jgi:chromosome segregation protein
MYLKNLTALGFKSFADKITMDFKQGITSIVGPNGCGKSNVADAIRWVLGEQSAKALRGSGMQDVIFSGTDKRKALGMAEVSLTLGDIDGEHLKAAGVEIDYNEVTVTRRVFRDGGSEYFINKTPCRLRDIQQLFMGTGVGRTSYSIMAQGNITQILSSKPEDRRMIFEEAAGITKFKVQKRESLRKLEHTDRNLERVSDLIREVKRQIGSLQRQAGKAKRFQKFQIELQHLDTQLARHRFDVLQGEIYQKKTEVEKLREEIESSSGGVLKAENEISQLRERLMALEQEIGRTQQRGMELKAEADQSEERIRYNQERMQELESQNKQALEEITRSEDRRLASEEELASVNERLEGANAELGQHRIALESRREGVGKIEADIQRRLEELRTAQAQSFTAAQELTRVRNEINALDLQMRGNVVRHEKLSSEKIQLEEERTRLEERLNEFSANVEAEKQNVANSRGTVEQRQTRLRELQEELNVAAGELDVLTRRQAELKSRLNVLEQLQESHEGFGEGALAALKQSESVLGTLADKISVPDQYVQAIETALGANLQLILTDRSESARAIIADLTEKKDGRASIASLDLRMTADSASQTFVSPNGFVPVDEGGAKPIAALSVVEVDEASSTLLKSLLGRTYIVPNLAAATEFWNQKPGERDFVTLDGELLDRHGVFTGGTKNGNGGAMSSLLARKNQIEQLRVQLTELQGQVDVASRAKGALQSEQTQLQAGLQEAQSQLRKQEVEIATREGEYNVLQNSLRVLHQKIDTVVYEIQSLGEQDREGKDKREALAANISELEKRDEELQGSVQGLNTGLDEFRQGRDAANGELTEAKVELATKEEKCASLRNQQRPLEVRIAEMKQLAEQRRSEIASFSERATRSEAEIATARQKIESLRHEREQIAETLKGKATERTALEGEIEMREEGLRTGRRALEANQEKRGALDVELAEKNMTVQNLNERVQQKYQINLEDVRGECITITWADEGQAKVETVLPDELESQGLSTNWEDVAKQVNLLQEKLDGMGPVNLVAIEEYEETEQRYEFLTNQHDDLVSAKTELMEVISRINVQTKQMFTETFDKIRENFKEMFTEIFNGGKADLILVDKENVLESGIDIVARPPGKKLQGISLLSGGEQTMTAVALLFAIYQVKPSPFCVLDELDAPLDESNINRFIGILKRFLDHSQFIIITHNKRTIGIADVLYGVTMQERGVSKIVSVKFHKTDDDSPHERPLVPPANGKDVEEEENEEHNKGDTLEITVAE